MILLETKLVCKEKLTEVNKNKSKQEVIAIIQVSVI